jgi:hypothetical protein
LNVVSEEKPDNQEPITEITCSSNSIENIQPIPMSPSNRKSIDEDVNSMNIEGMTDIGCMQIDQAQTAKTEKGSVEEGFCCVMSMHDGVVL